MSVAKKRKRMYEGEVPESATVSVKSRVFLDLLRRTYLGGCLGECVVVQDGKYATITAIDHNNMLWVNTKAKLILPQESLGLADLNLLTKFLPQSDESIDIEVKQNRMIVVVGTSKLKYLLTDPELISVQPDIAEEVGTSSMEYMTREVVLTEEAVAEFLRIQGILKREVVRVSVKHDTAMLSGGRDTEHQFEVRLGPTTLLKGKGSKKPKVDLYTQNLTPILSCLEFSKKNEPKLLFGDTLALIISKAQRTEWALFHVEE